MCKDFKSAGVGTAKFVECMFIYYFIFFKVEKKTHTRVLMITSEKREKNKTKKTKQNKQNQSKNKSKIRNETGKKNNNN